VGALWGLGHTTSLVGAGLLVIVLGVTIPKGVADLLEFCVALMIIMLGTRLMYLTLRRNLRLHVHTHALVLTHGTHSCLSRGRTYLVGVLHGLAGSDALTLLVLTEAMRNGSPVLGLAYLLVFGIGSTGGMLMMSSLIGIPFALSSRLPTRLPGVLPFSAAASSVVFRFYYGWQIIS
jgi:sulfite exporter TauE/SafE